MGTQIHDVFFSKASLQFLIKATEVSPTQQVAPILNLVEDSDIEEETNQQEENRDDFIVSHSCVTYPLYLFSKLLVLSDDLSLQAIRVWSFSKARTDVPLYIHYSDLRI